MGQTLTYFGPAGSGQYAKMSNQIAIASNMMGVCEAMAYAKKAASTRKKSSPPYRPELPAPGPWPTWRHVC